jgi:ankyrin repeat protein
LLAAKSDPNFQDESGVTALHGCSIPPTMFSVEEGPFDEAIIKLLFGAKADVSIKDHKGSTALDWALEHENFKIANIFRKEMSLPPLTDIKVKRRIEEVKRKTEGVEKAVIVLFKSSQLHDAIRQGTYDLVQKLLIQKADPNDKDPGYDHKTALGLAA